MEPSETSRLCGAVAPLRGGDGVASAFAAELRECIDQSVHVECVCPRLVQVGDAVHQKYSQDGNAKHAVAHGNFPVVLHGLSVDDGG